MIDMTTSQWPFGGGGHGVANQIASTMEAPPLTAREFVTWNRIIAISALITMIKVKNFSKNNDTNDLQNSSCLVTSPNQIWPKALKPPSFHNEMRLKPKSARSLSLKAATGILTDKSDFSQGGLRDCIFLAHTLTRIRTYMGVHTGSVATNMLVHT